MTHVLLDFATKKDPDLLLFGQTVHDSLVTNATALTGCPVSATDLDAANADFKAKLGAMAQGGTTATTDKNDSHDVLLGLLRQIAAWLEGKAQGNVDLITLAGFGSRASGHIAQSQLATPSIIAILNYMTTQLQLRVSPVPNAASYEVQYRIVGGVWISATPSSQARSIIVTGLTAGVLYEFRVRAIGGSTGCSDWSDTVSHMCT